MMPLTLLLDQTAPGACSFGTLPLVRVRGARTVCVPAPPPAVQDERLGLEWELGRAS